MANVQQNSNDNLAGIKLGQQLLASGMDGVKERLKNARAKIDDTKKTLLEAKNNLLEIRKRAEDEAAEKLRAEKEAELLKAAEAERKAKEAEETAAKAKEAEEAEKAASAAAQEEKKEEKVQAEKTVAPTAPAAPKTNPNVQVRVFDDKPQRSQRPQGGAAQGSRPQTGARPQGQSGFGQGRPNAGQRPQTTFAKPTVPPPQPSKPQNKDFGKKSKNSDNQQDKKAKDKRTLIRMGYIDDNGFVMDEDGEVSNRRYKSLKKKKEVQAPTQYAKIEKAVITSKIVPIKVLSEKIGKTGTEIIKQLFNLGIVKTINESIDFETAELVANELGIELELKVDDTAEESLSKVSADDENDENLVPRPPVVTIMGHVDHGKTSLLDYIRKANVASGEAGGITQHIGAYTVTLNGSPITFLDTPGHEAFTTMRLRGAMVTDIAVIVVAADDCIMPQTVEAINHAKAAGVQIIVAVNKIDKPGATPDRVLQQMTDYDLVPEVWGGTVPVCYVSAKTGQGVSELLETILLVAEVSELKANPNRMAKGSIIEAKLDKGRGPVATILVQNGTLNVGDNVVAGTVCGKIRNMFDDKGRIVKSAGPSTAVSVLGFEEVPNAGDQMIAAEDASLARKVAEERKLKQKEEIAAQNKPASLDDIFSQLSTGETKELNLIIKADVQGSVEAVKQSLLKLSSDEVKVKVVHGAVGAINESDIMLAKTSNAVVIGFNIRPDNNAKVIAEREKIDVRTYSIIYEAIDDVEKAIKGMLDPKFKENTLGRAEVRQVYKITGVGTVAGCMVIDGKIVRNCKVRLLRAGVIIYDGQLSSLKRFKDDVKEVARGYDCGMSIQNFSDIKEGDVIEAYVMEQINE